MKRYFVIADTHFSHENIITFKDKEGKIIRDFKNIEDMDNHIVTKWNSVVTSEDTVYLLGDVAMKEKGLKQLERCNGRKVLVKGNHDIFRKEKYLKHFDDIRAYVVKEGAILSHIPIHPESLTRFKLNIHGHLHANKINDPKYICVSCEQVNYTPVLLEELLK